MNSELLTCWRSLFERNNEYSSTEYFHAPFLSTACDQTVNLRLKVFAYGICCMYIIWMRKIKSVFNDLLQTSKHNYTMHRIYRVPFISWGKFCMIVFEIKWKKYCRLWVDRNDDIPNSILFPNELGRRRHNVKCTLSSGYTIWYGLTGTFHFCTLCCNRNIKYMTNKSEAVFSFGYVYSSDHHNGGCNGMFPFV